MQKGISLKQHLEATEVHPALKDLIIEVALTTKEIAHKINNAALEGALGFADSINVQNEKQKKLDIITNGLMYNHLKTVGLLSGMGSEEVDNPIQIPSEYAKGKYLIFFDPLDGSSNVDVNISVGTIFSIIKNPKGKHTPTVQDYLTQTGTEQVVSGFVVYGPYTTLVLTTGSGVSIFALDTSIGEYTLVRNNITIPTNTTEFAINMSNKRFWEPPIIRYIDDCLAGETGVFAKRYNMRWVASMVAEVFRILTRGGIFLYPIDTRFSTRGGKLRLMYEANPMAMIIEQAGGIASTGYDRILDIQPQSLHQCVPVIFGSKNEVEKVVQYHLTNEK